MSATPIWQHDIPRPSRVTSSNPRHGTPLATTTAIWSGPGLQLRRRRRRPAAGLVRRAARGRVAGVDLVVDLVEVAHVRIAVAAARPGGGRRDQRGEDLELGDPQRYPGETRIVRPRCGASFRGARLNLVVTCSAIRVET